MDDNFGLKVIENNKVVTSSRNVAEVFEKEHRNVLEAVRNLECSEDFRLLNFKQSSETVAMPNGGTREQPIYLITRDGFTFLAMGFTGAKAARFKEGYINAFNEMEKGLTSQAAIPDFSNPAYVVQLAQNWLAEKERADYFERTKAQIGSRREATAMYTASVLKKQLNKVMDTLGYGRQWVQVKGIG